ncbi:MAG: type II secretion system protein [Clostridia bacterium]|nr:type II secretion system protein [Clostridia bacterium]
MRKTNKKGFTIVELVIVIAVIAILASILIPTFSGVIGEAGDAAAAANAKAAYTEYVTAQVQASAEVEENVVVVVNVNGEDRYFAVVAGQIQEEADNEADAMEAVVGAASTGKVNTKAAITGYDNIYTVTKDGADAT